MKSALVILNGIRFPYYLVDHVIAWAKNNNASLYALFVKAADEAEEGYIYPSDLDAAEDLSDTDDAEEGDAKVIQSQMKLLEDMAKTESIPFQSELLTDPSLNDILTITKGKDLVFIDSNFDEAGILSVSGFKLRDLVKKSSSPVEAIKAPI